MTISRIEKLIIVVGLKLSVVVGFLASLGFVGSLFLGRPVGPTLRGVCGCLLALDAASIVYLGICLAVVAALQRGEGA